MPKSLLTFAVLFLGMVGLIFISSDRYEPSSPDEQVVVAKRLINEAQYGEAIRLLSEVIEKQPQHPDAYFQRAFAYSLIGDRSHALIDFNNDVQINPGRAASFNNRSLIHKANGHFDLAAADAHRAVALNPDSVEYRHNRADTCFRTGETATALADLYEVREWQPDNPYTGFYLAWFYATCPDEKYREPKSAIKYAIEGCEASDWKLGFLISTLAIAHAADGQFSEAIEYEKQARELYSPSEMQEWGDRLQKFENEETIIDETIVVPDDPIELPRSSEAIL